MGEEGKDEENKSSHVDDDVKSGFSKVKSILDDLKTPLPKDAAVTGSKSAISHDPMYKKVEQRLAEK